MLYWLLSVESESNAKLKPHLPTNGSSEIVQVFSYHWSSPGMPCHSPVDLVSPSNVVTQPGMSSTGKLAPASHRMVGSRR